MNNPLDDRLQDSMDRVLTSFFGNEDGPEPDDIQQAMENLAQYPALRNNALFGAWVQLNAHRWEPSDEDIAEH